MLDEAHDAVRALGRAPDGANLMYFETGQGAALSAEAHHGMDQQTMETRAYAVARRYDPLLVNTVVGFIGPEYLADGKQIIRAGLEDHFCGKLLGLPMGVDICYTNHSFADQEDMDVLLTALAAAGVSFVITVPGADDIMLNYQSLSFHDALFIRDTLGHPPAPEFEAWMQTNGIGTPEASLPSLDAALGACACPLHEPPENPHAPRRDREPCDRGAADLRGGDARSTPPRRSASPSTTPARGRP
jgi:ethanolamine ammonia-lyase large subunit